MLCSGTERPKESQSYSLLGISSRSAGLVELEPLAVVAVVTYSYGEAQAVIFYVCVSYYTTREISSAIMLFFLCKYIYIGYYTGSRSARLDIFTSLTYFEIKIQRRKIRQARKNMQPH